MFNLRNLVIGLVLAVLLIRSIGVAMHRKGHTTSSSMSFAAGKSDKEMDTDSDDSDDARKNGSVAGSSQNNGAVYHLGLHKVTDTEGTGQLACTFLLPDGWTSQDQVKWIVDDYMTPVVGTSSIRSSDGLEQIDTMSGIETNYSHGPLSSAGSPPPKSLSHYMLGMWKKNHSGHSCEVLSIDDSPIDTSNDPGNKLGQVFASRGSFKIRYHENGRTMLCKTQARIDGFQTHPMPTAIGGVIYEGGWTISSFFAVAAPEDRLPDAMKTAGIILTSTKMDPHFFNTVMQARQVIQQNFYNMQCQIRETSRIISQTNDAISDSIMSSYNRGQAVEDKEITGFDDYIRGVDKYDDSDGKTDLPSGYAHAWKDESDHYIVTDEHLYDPNVSGPGGTWHELQKSQ